MKKVKHSSSHAAAPYSCTVQMERCGSGGEGSGAAIRRAVRLLLFYNVSAAAPRSIHATIQTTHAVIHARPLTLLRQVICFFSFGIIPATSPPQPACGRCTSGWTLTGSTRSEPRRSRCGRRSITTTYSATGCSSTWQRASRRPAPPPAARPQACCRCVAPASLGLDPPPPHVARALDGGCQQPRRTGLSARSLDLGSRKFAAHDRRRNWSRNFPKYSWAPFQCELLATWGEADARPCFERRGIRKLWVSGDPHALLLRAQLVDFGLSDMLTC